MKRYIRQSLLLFMMTICCGISAQNVLQTYRSKKTTDEQIAFLNDTINKAAYIKALNDRIKEAGLTAEITDVAIVGDTIQASSSKSSMLTGNMLTGNPFDAAGYISCHDTYTFTYESVDGQNNPVRLSCRLYTPHAEWVRYIVDLDYGILYCHPTTTTNLDVPTGQQPIDKAVSCLVSEDCFVCCPDYTGYGINTYRQHPYLVQDVTAKNCIDAYLEAKRLVPIFTGEGSPYESDFKTYIFGYSQGGSVALACHKYIECGILSSDKVKAINLMKTICGDGPYSPPATVEQYLKWANSDNVSERKLEYACVLPLIVMAMKDAYDKSCMRTVKVEDYFTDEFLATGIVDAIKSKGMSTDDIAKFLPDNLCLVPNCFSEKMVKTVRLESGKDTIVFNTESNEYKCLMRALRNNDLTKGWVPQHKICFFHWPNDRVVPECNFTEVKKNLESGYWSSSVISSITASDAKKSLGIESLFAIGLDWDNNTATHASTGELFYRWYFTKSGECERY